MHNSVLLVDDDTSLLRLLSIRLEAEGYLLMLANDLETSLTELMVFDALDIQSGPRCRARLPVRIPAGFHGTWVGTD